MERTGYLAVDVGGTEVKWARVSDGMEIAVGGRTATGFADAGELADAVAALFREAGGDVRAVALSCPGTVPGDEAGTVLGGGILRYLDGCQLGREVAVRCGVPASVENDGKAAALGEYASGALKGVRVGSVMVLGTAVGGGIVVDGQVLRGAHGFAGEYSFVFDEPTTYLGGVAYPAMMGYQCGWPGLRRLVFKELGRPVDESVDGRQIFGWVDAGDEAARRGLERYADVVGRLACNVQALVDPEVIAIGGGISAQPALVEAVARHAAAFAERNGLGAVPRPNVVAAVHGNDANLLGAVYQCRMRNGWL